MVLNGFKKVSRRVPREAEGAENIAFDFSLRPQILCALSVKQAYAWFTKTGCSLFQNQLL